MWRDICTSSAGFGSAVLTGRDAGGYPFSVRCTPALDHERQVIRFEPAAGAAIEPGPAGVLFHRHNEELWDLTMFQVLGRLERDERGWCFIPERLATDTGSSPLSALRMILQARRSAARYLAKRGLARPSIPWEQLKGLYPPATRPGRAAPAAVAAGSEQR